jgi:putative membrane protein
MLEQLPYCGSAPNPGELLGRFNLDPILIATLILVGGAHIALVPAAGGKGRTAAGWLVAAAAFISPLCALSLALFSARIAQHMILILLAAPLIASARPAGARQPRAMTLWVAVAVFFISLWVWHMPVPYDATFKSTGVYWLMHLSIFGSAIFLWHALLHHRHDRLVAVLSAGAITSMQMGLLGAILTFAAHPLYLSHLTTTWGWGLTPLRDQQLGGVFMWVPGIAAFLWTALRSLSRVWTNLERVKEA